MIRGFVRKTLLCDLTAISLQTYERCKALYGERKCSPLICKISVSG